MEHVNLWTPSPRDTQGSFLHEHLFMGGINKGLWGVHGWSLLADAYIYIWGYIYICIYTVIYSHDLSPAFFCYH